LGKTTWEKHGNNHRLGKTWEKPGKNSFIDDKNPKLTAFYTYLATNNIAQRKGVVVTDEKGERRKDRKKGVR